MAQKKSITGIITDTAGEAVIGASIVEVGTTNGTVSDVEGNFTLSVSDNASIQVSFIGFSSQTLSVQGKMNFKIILKEDSETFAGSCCDRLWRKSFTGKTDEFYIDCQSPDIREGYIYKSSQALSGSVPGLKVSLTSGNPTSSPKVILRGGTEFDGSGGPLVIVDGQLRDNFDDINPQDIASMDVLKDAGATAIYGARASNGVILITTKSGRAGHREINFRANIGLGYVNNPYDFLGAEDYITVLRTAYKNTPWAATANLTGSTPFGTGNKLGANMVWNIMGKTDENAYLLDMGWREMLDPLDPSKTIIYKGTKPEEYNLRNPVVTQDYTVSMSGGMIKELIMQVWVITTPPEPLSLPNINVIISHSTVRTKLQIG